MYRNRKLPILKPVCIPGNGVYLPLVIGVKGWPDKYWYHLIAFDGRDPGFWAPDRSYCQ